MRIPEIRDEMLVAAKETADPALQEKILRWERELHRRKPVRHTASRGRRMTDELADAIQRYAADFPGEGYLAMSLRFSVSIGRISEVLAGRRA